MPRNEQHSEGAQQLDRLQSLMIFNGAAVIVVGLVSGFGLMFALLQEVAIWPIPWSLDVALPGSTRGWQAAHVGGILNGVMIVSLATCLPLVPLTERRRQWVAWGLIYTGWANTIFYHFGNLAANRGLSGGTNALGEGSIAGFIAYVPAAVATVVTTVVVAMVGLAALRRARQG